MKLLDHIIGVFDDSQYGKHESALLHACIAVDATAKRLYPSTAGSRIASLDASAITIGLLSQWLG